MSSRSLMSQRYARVSFVRNKPRISSTTRITPMYYGKKHRSSRHETKSQSIRSVPMMKSEFNDSSLTSNDPFVSSTLQPFQYKLNSNNRQQTYISNQSYSNKHHKISLQKKQISCKQKCLFLALLFTALLILITFILPYILIYFLSQKITFYMQSSQSTTITDVTNHSYHCAGMAKPLIFSTLDVNTLKLDVNTSSCSFNSTPLYFTSFDGIGNQYGLTSYTAIYAPTRTSFTVFVTSIFSWNAAFMLNLSIAGDWRLNWVGMTH